MQTKSRITLIATIAVLVMALFPALAFADLQAGDLENGRLTESSTHMTAQGDSMGTATSIPLNQATSGSLSSYFDSNWYKVNLPSNGKFEIVLGGAYSTSGRWDVELYTADNERVWSGSYATNNTVEKAICTTGLPAGTYYISIDCVYLSQMEGLVYRLTPKLTPDPFWETELNDTIVTADELSLGKTVYGCLQYHGGYLIQDIGYGAGDADWYKVTLSKRGTFGVLFSGEYWSSGSLTVSVYSEDNQELTSDKYSLKNTKPQLQCLTTLEAGTYFIKINDWTASGVTDVSYNLTPYYIASKPTANTGLVYNGTTQTGVNKQEGSTLSGTVSAVNAGSYSATATLDSAHIWPDGTRDAITVPWTIAGGNSSSDGSGSGKSDLGTYVGVARAAGFTDLASGAWYMSTATGAFASSKTLYLDYTIKCGLMSGYAGSTLFGPDDTLSRGMAATIIYRMATGKTAGNTDNNVTTKFSDVPKGAYYAAAVKWCSESGVVTGYNDVNGKPTGKFGPDDKVTREQLTAMIARYCTGKAGMKSAGRDVSRFKDAGKIAEWAKEGVAFCAANAIVSGIGDTGNFQPQGNATRCQMSKIIAVTARMLE